MVKKEVLKLLHAGVIYLVPYSEWVSLVHVIPKKGGMMVVENKKLAHSITNDHEMENVYRL